MRRGGLTSRPTPSVNAPNHGRCETVPGAFVDRMNLLRLSLLLSLVALVGSVRAAGEPRRVEIAAPDRADAAYREQAGDLLAAWAGLRERDVEVTVRLGAPAFAFRLIGRDGGVKLRRDRPVPAEELFAVIDAMPMRQAERREKRPAGG